MTPEQLELDVDQQAEYRSKTGKKVALVEAYIVDEDMNKLPHDGETAGEIVVRAPWLTPNYYKDNKTLKHYGVAVTCTQVMWRILMTKALSRSLTA